MAKGQGQTCRIQWIDAKGDPTPDQNLAVGRVRIQERTYPQIYPDKTRLIHHPASNWTPICKEHAQLVSSLPGWTFEPFDEVARIYGPVVEVTYG